MIDWLNNIWLWVVENRNEIVTAVVSGQALTFVAGLIMIIRQFKTIRSNTEITGKVNNTMLTTNEVNRELKDLNSNLNEQLNILKEETSQLNSDLIAIKDETASALSVIVDKVNVILEVQTLVYSTIKDEDMRKTVNTLLNNARYTEINLKDQFQMQLDELKKQVDEKVNEITGVVDEAVLKSNIVPEVKAKKKSLMRY